MAGRDGDEAPKKKKGTFGAAVVWILMAMLVVGLGGFGITNFGGGQTIIGSVGDREIDANDYGRALQAELRAFSAQIGSEVTMAQAQALGLDQRVRERLIANAALDNEASRVGISVGDARVADEIMTVSAFQGVDGRFDRATYARTLQQNGMTETGFEAQVRADLARSILQGAVAGGFVTPPALTDTLQAWAMERRGFTVLRLTPGDLSAPLPEPTEADLIAWYEAHPADFTAPEARRITYAALLPEMLADRMTLDEAALRDQYEARIDEFVQPERRLVERLVFPDEATAAAARARFDAGTSFETLVAERGLSLADIDLGEQSQADLGAAGAAIFALNEPGVAGPLPSDFGPALYRMNGVLAAQETSFEEARPVLAAEQGTEAARRAIAGRVEAINDLLAGGAALEDLAGEEGMQVATFDWRPGSEEPIAGYADFQEAAAAVQEGDFPEVVMLDDGGIVALRLDEIVPPTLRPFPQVAGAVEAAWRADALTRALAVRAEEIRGAIEGGAAPGAFGVADVIRTITRDGFLEDMPETLLPTAFSMAEGEARVISGPDFTGVIRLDSIHPAPTDDPAAQAMKSAIAAQADQALAQDAFALFTNALIAEAGVMLNDQMIAAVNAQFR
jgi:peptidyl-prolyl cis-trans isomerase D